MLTDSQMAAWMIAERASAVSTAAVDVKTVKDNLPQLLETRAWPKFVVAEQAYLHVPPFCPDDCTGSHGSTLRLPHQRREDYSLHFCNEHGETQAQYRYVGRDQPADTSLWELSELRDG